MTLQQKGLTIGSVLVKVVMAIVIYRIATKQKRETHNEAVLSAGLKDPNSLAKESFADTVSKIKGTFKSSKNYQALTDKEKEYIMFILDLWAQGNEVELTPGGKYVADSGDKIGILSVVKNKVLPKTVGISYKNAKELADKEFLPIDRYLKNVLMYNAALKLSTALYHAIWALKYPNGKGEALASPSTEKPLEGVKQTR